MFQMISMAQLEAWLNGPRNFTLVDVRSSEEFASGHLEGAINIPAGEIRSTAAALLPKDRPVILYCSHGSHSLMAARALSSMGYRAIEASGGLNYYRGRHLVRE